MAALSILQDSGQVSNSSLSPYKSLLTLSTGRKPEIFFSASVIWGLIAPQRFFAGQYSVLYWVRKPRFICSKAADAFEPAGVPDRRDPAFYPVAASQEVWRDVLEEDLDSSHPAWRKSSAPSSPVR